jgi:uncharacterized protein (DUF952 family)
VNLTYHGTPAEHFDSISQTQPYVAPSFAQEGFIHCTDGEVRLAEILSAYYSDSKSDWLVLYIDKDRVAAPIKYQDPENVFPHIYGPLNRDAIIAVRELSRLPDGRFLAPPRTPAALPHPPA